MISNPTGLTIDDETVPYVDSFKYLGLIMDSSLTWQHHIDQLSITLSRMCGLIRKLTDFLPFKALEKLYFAFFHSHLQHLAIIWGSASNERLKRIQVLQNRCLKLIHKLPQLYSSALLFTDSKIKTLPIRALYHQQLMIHTYSVVNRQDLLTNMRFSRRTHSHLTRRANHLPIPRVRTNYGKRSFGYLGPVLFNRLPQTLKNYTPSSKFKKELKMYLKSNVTLYLR